MIDDLRLPDWVRGREADVLIAAGYPPESAAPLARIVIENDSYPLLVRHVQQRSYPKMRGVAGIEAAMKFIAARFDSRHGNQANPPS